MDWKVLRRYKEGQLKEIALPVGGIGTGFFSFGGRGQFFDWQIGDRPSRYFKPQLSHLLLWVKDAKGQAHMRVLESDLNADFAGDSGNPEYFAGIPRFATSEFEASYPFGRALLSGAGKSLPMEAEIEAFNPLIPPDAELSGMPMGLLTIKVKNKMDGAIDGSVTLALENFIGASSGVRDLKGNVTEAAETAGWKGMLFRKQTDVKAPTVGTVCALWDAPRVEVARRIKVYDRGWRHEVLSIIDQILANGKLDDVDPTSDCPPSDGDGWLSAASAFFSAPAGGTATLRLLIAWCFPWRDPKSAGWWIGAPKEPELFRNFYATKFTDAKDVAAQAIPQLDSLYERTGQFVNSVANKRAPDILKEGALFNLGALRSHTCFRLEDGSFCAFEGCNGSDGCCCGSCTHVWNYEQATISLFPDLHRSMLETHLEHNVTPTGAERFRIGIPLKNADWRAAAADGQMGLIVRCYMQYKTDQNRDWLTKHYPAIKKMVEYAWIEGGWDEDKDGVMEGAQHNTYDVEFFGPNPLCTGWYLAALRAAALLAKAAGDDEFATQCDGLAAKGADWMDKNLYNGAYYVQKPAPMKDKPDPMTFAGDGGSSSPEKYQVGPGCLIDQLCGQYKANRAGLGNLLDAFHIKTAALAIFRNNYLEGFREHYNDMRTFAYGDESGSTICSYPEGGRPTIPFPYWGECMTGFEYQLAALLIDCGHRNEGLKVAAAVRNRHEGSRRNPFSEPECGSFYARSMASWGVLQAWEGA